MVTEPDTETLGQLDLHRDPRDTGHTVAAHPLRARPPATTIAPNRHFVVPPVTRDHDLRAREVGPVGVPEFPPHGPGRGPFSLGQRQKGFYGSPVDRRQLGGYQRCHLEGSGGTGADEALDAFTLVRLDVEEQQIPPACAGFERERLSEARLDEPHGSDHKSPEAQSQRHRYGLIPRTEEVAHSLADRVGHPVWEKSSGGKDQHTRHRP